MSVFSTGRWRVSWMATLSILRFCTAGGAKAALGDVWALVDSGRLALRDMAIMSWDPSRAIPDTCQVVPDRRDAQLGPRFWNLLFSHVFYLPLAATRAGVQRPTSTAPLADLGIRDDFLDTAQRRLGPGTSALFLLTGDATVDRVIMLLHGLEFTIMSTNLTQRQVRAVCDTFHPAHQQEWSAATIDRNGQKVPGWIPRAGGEQASPATRTTPLGGSAPHPGMEEEDDDPV
jgi:uncharacterized membrane protein